MDGTLNFHASKPKDNECVYWEMEMPMDRLLSLAKHGRLLIKSEYLQYIPLCIDALLLQLIRSPRKLIPNELKFCEDIKQLKKLISENKIILPLRTCMPHFESVIYAENSLADIKGAQDLYYIIDDLIFGSIRPDSWLTPGDAEREVKSYFAL